jgi:DNA polymerase V
VAKIYALVDCNAFFCSCERLFRPDLIGKPLGVLSNNDGCFVSRTKELKKLDVKMGAPYFKVKDICEKNKVHVFSSNFSLYTNMSDRVMMELSRFTPELEVYSVDEAFLNLTGFSDIKAYSHEIKRVVERRTGIPVSVGVGPTKTLAKIANHMAKKYAKLNGVMDLSDKETQDKVLPHVKVEDIWGVAGATKEKLNAIGIYTAKEYRDFKNDPLIKKIFTKVGLQRKDELNGQERFKLELITKKKKEIMCSRTFGSPVYDIKELRESVANYVSSACEKLRKQKSSCAEIMVYTRTSPFKNTPQYYAIDTYKMLSHTSDTRRVIKYAVEAIENLYRMGYEYKKAGIKLSNIRDREQSQLSLFEKPETPHAEALMRAMDYINAKEGPGTVKVASCGVDNKAWNMNRNMKSPRYVSSWTELRAINTNPLKKI